MSDFKVRAIRGATTVAKDDSGEITHACLELTERIVKLNNLDPKEIATVIVTMTSDLHSQNASGAIRNGMNWQDVPFFTTQEAEIEKMLPRCIRVLIQYNTPKPQSEMVHVYLNEAVKLRPDLANRKS